ncbi:hypothetical protein N7471_008387 [Penicillium samsonianum]|uniref:uncharacterized protein n=1 Tax=Penicillium samsonianum TaxID=1882272 RepID=UPI002547DE06|nr:uncharacterized protein N7471_008387 [Penicillium samsonianum]KAJ6133172.1 hypothetical protein N7471_008387 [Penicillium samsonianum]
MLDAAYTFDEVPQPDWHATIHTNRVQDRTPRQPPAVAQSRQRPVVIAPTAHVETAAFLRSIRGRSSGPAYEATFHPAQEQGRPSSQDSDIDENRRRPEYVQQVRFQGTALAELTSLPRHARPARPDPRRR